jgi:hypothetical protein
MVSEWTTRVLHIWDFGCIPDTIMQGQSSALTSVVTRGVFMLLDITIYRDDMPQVIGFIVDEAYLLHNRRIRNF